MQQFVMPEKIKDEENEGKERTDSTDHTAN